jgi:hypothetical protein
MWVMSVAVTAAADDGAASTSVVSAPKTPRPPLHWYGYQTLAVDAAFDAAYFIGTNVKFSESGFVTALGVFVPFFTGLAVHEIHDRPGGVLALSVILRLVVPLVVGAATMRAVPSPCSSAVNSESDVLACPFAAFPSYTGFLRGGPGRDGTRCGRAQHIRAYAPGVQPTMRRKCRCIWLWSQNPTSGAISEGRRPRRRRMRARAIRACVRNAYGGKPISREKARHRWNLSARAWSARASRVTSSAT